MSARINSTVSTPSVIVKIEGKTNTPGKKLPLPNDLNTFMKQIESRFGLSENILSLYTENGEAISDVSQIFPSTTIIASTQQMSWDHSNEDFDDPRFQNKDEFAYQDDNEEAASYNSGFEEEDIIEYQKPQVKPTSSKTQTANQRTTANEQDEEFQNPTKDSRRTNMNKQQNSYQNASKDSRQNNNFASQEQNEEENLTKTKTTGNNQASNQKQIPDKEESLDYDEIQEIEEEEDDYLQSDDDGTNEAPNQEEMKQATEKMLGPQFQDSQIKEMVSNYFSNIDPKTQNFYLQAAAEENLEQRYQFQKLISSLVHPTHLIEKESLILYDKIIERIDSIINHHRTITDGCVAYNMKTIIVGPRNSGKSTILSFLTERFLMELSTTQTWKRNFVFIFDAKKLASSFSNFLDFYDEYVNMIFNSLQIQRPGFVPYVESICNYFKSIPRNKEQLSPLPKRFETNEDFRLAARSLKQIAIELFKCVQDSSAFMAWHTNVLLMPSLVSSAFGFSQIHYIVDNAEYLDAQFTPLEPFTGTVDGVDIVEYFKYAISNSSFCISCESMNDFLEIFGPREDSVDLIRDAEFVDVFGFDTSSVNGKDMAFMVKFEGDKRSFKFTIEDCGGCPAYLSCWDEMCFELERNQNDWNVGIESYNEQQLSVKNLLEFILKSVFVVEDDDEELDKIVHNPITEIHPTKIVA